MSSSAINRFASAFASKRERLMSSKYNCSSSVGSPIEKRTGTAAAVCGLELFLENGLPAITGSAGKGEVSCSCAKAGANRTAKIDNKMVPARKAVRDRDI